MSAENLCSRSATENAGAIVANNICLKQGLVVHSSKDDFGICELKAAGKYVLPRTQSAPNLASEVSCENSHVQWPNKPKHDVVGCDSKQSAMVPPVKENDCSAGINLASANASILRTGRGLPDLPTLSCFVRPARQRCHCIACCSWSPADCQHGLCAAGIHLCQKSDSFDSGLERICPSVNPCPARQLCRMSEARLQSGKPHWHEASVSDVKHEPPNANPTFSTSTTVSDACPSVSLSEADDQEVFLPKSSSILSKVGIPPTEFRRRFNEIIKWFNDFDDDQRNVLLSELVNTSRLPQMHLLSMYMAPRMHAGCPPNCQDLLSQMPEMVAFKILSYLDPVSLCRSSMVCHRWRHLANESFLWRRLCFRANWKLSHSTAEQKQYSRFKSSSGLIDWKGMFAERYRLRINWLKGRCNVRTFEGHTQGVSCVQFDDSRIVSGSSDKTIKLWNIRTNSPWAAQTLVGHSGTVRCLHLEGNRLVSGSADHTIKVWDLSAQASWTSIACKVTMVGHTDTVRCLQVDDDKVVSGSYDKTLKVWDLKTGLCRQTLRGHEAAVLCVQYDQEKIISGSCDKTIKVWSFDSTCIATLVGHQDAVTCLQFDNRRIISGSIDRTLRFWDLQSRRCIKTIDWKASEGHTGVIRYLQSDSWRVVSASDDRTIKVWSLETGKRLVTLRNHTDGVTCLQFNDSVIVSGSYDRTVKLWDFGCC